MSITYKAGRIVEFTLDETVGINLPAPQPDPSLAHTVRITPPFRRPNATGDRPLYRPSWSFGSVVDQPTPTEDLPPFAAYAARREAMPYAGRHRLSLAARLLRLFGFGRRNGA